jgi:hypothetical protein
VPRGRWINGTPSLSSGSLSNVGFSFISPQFDWPWGYVQIAQVSGTVSGVVQASVECVDDELCAQLATWQMHRAYSVSASGSVLVGPNLWASLIGLRFGFPAALGANIVLATGKVGFAGYQLYSQYGAIGGMLVSGLLAHGPDYICNYGFPNLPGQPVIWP